MKSRAYFLLFWDKSVRKRGTKTKTKTKTKTEGAMLGH